MRMTSKILYSGGIRNTAGILAVLFLLSACTTPRYITDPDSLRLQKSIQGKRAGNIASETFLTLGSTVLALFTGVYVGYVPEGKSLKRIALGNTGSDTLQVNMLTDVIWKDSTYADFMNIRIPPGKTCRLLVPAGSVYNLYFSNTFETTDDDEFIQFDTSAMRKATLYPGMTFLNDSTTEIKQIPIP